MEAEVAPFGPSSLQEICKCYYGMLNGENFKVLLKKLRSLQKFKPRSERPFCRCRQKGQDWI